MKLTSSSAGSPLFGGSPARSRWPAAAAQSSAGVAAEDPLIPIDAGPPSIFKRNGAMQTLVEDLGPSSRNPVPGEAVEHAADRRPPSPENKAVYLAELLSLRMFIV